MEIYGGSTARKYEDLKNLSNRILSLSVDSNYNFKRGKKFSSLIEVEVGIVSCKVVQEYYGNDAVKTIITLRLVLKYLIILE